MKTSGVQGLWKGVAVLASMVFCVGCLHRPKPEIIPGENYWEDRDTSPYTLGWEDSISIMIQRHPEFTGSARVARDGTIVLPYNPFKALPQNLGGAIPPVEAPMEELPPGPEEEEAAVEEGLRGSLSRVGSFEGLIRVIEETGGIDKSKETGPVESGPEASAAPTIPPTLAQETAYPKEKLILRVEGLTVPQVEAKIRERLEEFIIDPQVFVEVVDYQSKYVWVVGEVGREGKLPIQGNYIRVREAAFRAGWKPELAALRRVKVIRPDITDPKMEEIDLKALVYKGELRHNLRLNHGDILFVPQLRTEKVAFLVGQFLKPFESIAGVIVLGIILNLVGI